MTSDDMHSFVTLREHVEHQIAALDRRLGEQRDASNKAIEKAEVALGRRLDGMNEFREALRDQSSRMATREQLEAMKDRVVAVEQRGAVAAAIVSVGVSLVVSFLVGLLVRWLS